MADRKLVSVLTPTWRRHELLWEAIDDVRHQTYRPIEHVIVSDGQDDDLSRRIFADRLNAPCPVGSEGYVPLRFVPLGRNWSTYLPDSFCAAPTVVAMLMARGDYQAWLADDERMDPDHIASLVELLESSGADFAYSRVRMVGKHGERYEIGTDPPRLGEITNVVYRTELLRLGLYPFGAGMTSDWACISAWQSKGARHAFSPRATLLHQVDH